MGVGGALFGVSFLVLFSFFEAALTRGPVSAFPFRSLHPKTERDKMREEKIYTYIFLIFFFIKKKSLLSEETNVN